MKCREVAEFIGDYVAGELPAEVKEAFERHLTRCPNCVGYLATYRATIEAGRRAFEDGDADATLVVPEDLVKVILDSRKS